MMDVGQAPWHHSMRRMQNCPLVVQKILAAQPLTSPEPSQPRHVGARMAAAAQAEMAMVAAPEVGFSGHPWGRKQIKSKLPLSTNRHLIPKLFHKVGLLVLWSPQVKAMSCMGKCCHCKNGHSFKCCSFSMWTHRLHTLRGLEIENSNAHCTHRHSIFWPCSESFKHTCVALASATSIYRMRKGCMFCTHHSPAAFKRLTQLTPYDLIGPSFQQNSIMLQVHFTLWTCHAHGVQECHRPQPHQGRAWERRHLGISECVSLFVKGKQFGGVTIWHYTQCHKSLGMVKIPPIPNSKFLVIRGMIYFDIAYQ